MALPVAASLPVLCSDRPAPAAIAPRPVSDAAQLQHDQQRVVLAQPERPYNRVMEHGGIISESIGVWAVLRWTDSGGVAIEGVYESLAAAHAAYKDTIDPRVTIVRTRYFAAADAVAEPRMLR